MQSDKSVRLSELMQSSVRSQEGKTLGNIRDLTIDPQSGQVEFAILSLSSAGAATDTATAGRETVPSSRSSIPGVPSTAAGSTMTGKLIPVPWQLFSQSMSGASATTGIGSSAMGSQNLVLNIDESKLRTAPSFDAASWNQLQAGQLEERVYSHFGVDKSSATGMPGSSVRGEGAGALDHSTPRSTQPGSSAQPRSSTLPGSSTQPGSSTIQPGSSTTRPDSSPER